MNGMRSLGSLVVAVAVVVAISASADAANYKKGDVFAGVGQGQIKEFTPSGNLRQTLDTTSGSNEDTGMCFDKHGNLYATDFSANHMTKFDNAANVLIEPFGSGFNTDPESCVVNKAGDLYVGQADGSQDILKFDKSGTMLDSFDAAPAGRGTDWIDLAKNQCTMLYTGEGAVIKRYNVCTDTQLGDFATLAGGQAFALRILPDKQVLVADGTRVLRLDPSGNVVKTYPGSDYGYTGSDLLFALNIDPDGKTFWTASLPTGVITRIKIQGGAQVKQFNANAPVDVAGLAVFGEQTQGGGGPPPPPPGHKCKGATTLSGTNGDNHLVGTSGRDRILARGGDDVIKAKGGDDCARGGRGQDLVVGGPGEDHLVGGKGNDVVRGGKNSDRIRALGGRRDRVNCGGGHDTVIASANDVVRHCEVVRNHLKR